MTVAQLTHMAPVLIVDRVEPCLKFWVDRFGFTVANEVPGPDGLVFASVKKEAIELMFQTRASVVAEAPGTEKSSRDIRSRSSSPSTTSVLSSAPSPARQS
jgi:hypothetical protein